MRADLALLTALSLLAGVLAGPALIAWQRRRSSAEASAVALELLEFARRLRRENRCIPLEENLLTRVERLRLPELGAFRLAPNLPNVNAGIVADAALRLALRLKRRVAFERKMLARTASGRRRGAIAGALPPLVVLILVAAGAELPASALVFLVLAEGVGGWLLTRIASVAP
jgi:Flp pilus assembly protein TadB